MLDRAVLHRVAEATIKDFLDQVGGAVTAAAATVPAESTC
jgi:hypothetical protein